MSEPAICLRRKIRLNTAGDGCGSAGAPTRHSVPSRLSSAVSASRLCGAATVSRMKSKLPAWRFISSGFAEITTSSAPSRRASAALPGEVVNRTVWAPNAWANFTPMWPEAAEPDDADLLPAGRRLQCRSGE